MLIQYLITLAYSKLYSNWATFPGNFPFFLTGTQGTFRYNAIRVPNKNPRASNIATQSTLPASSTAYFFKILFNIFNPSVSWNTLNISL